MANYNIEMQYYNGSSYDTLYPNIPISAVSDWEDNVYSKNEINNKIGNANYSMNLIGTYNLSANDTNLGGSTIISDNVYEGLFEGTYDGFYFIIKNTCQGSNITYAYYVLSLDNFSVCPIYATNNTECNIVAYIPIVSKSIFRTTRKYLFINNFYVTDSSIGQCDITAPVISNNNINYITLKEEQEISGSSRLSLNGQSDKGSGSIAACTVEVSIYKYKLNLNT